MLPTDIFNLVGYFAFGGDSYSFANELEFVQTNRGLVPDAFLQTCVTRLGFATRMTRVLGYYSVKNPLRTDNPFFPWALVDPHVIVFSNTFQYWADQLTFDTFRKLRTYPKIFRKHARRCAMSGKNFGSAWNFLVERYFLHSNALQNVESYNSGEAIELFRDICDDLQHSGFISPGTSIPTLECCVPPSRLFFAPA